MSVPPAPVGEVYPANEPPPYRLPPPHIARQALVFAVAAVVTSWCLVGVVPAVVALIFARRASKAMPLPPDFDQARRLVIWARALAWFSLAVAAYILVVTRFATL